MGSVAYDFLADSFLFDDRYIEDNYSAKTEHEITRELDRYREYCLNSIQSLRHDASQSETELRIFSGLKMPNPELLKQHSLYVQQYVLDDPLFAHSKPKNELTREMDFIANLSQEMDKSNIARSAKYLKDLTPMVVADYVKIFPASLYKEPPSNLSLKRIHISNYEELPEAIGDYFRDSAKVFTVERNDSDRNLITLVDPVPCRDIIIQFPDHNQDWTHGFLMFEQEVKSINKQSDESYFVEIASRLPEEKPDDKLFKSWVEQSIEAAGRRIYKEIETDVQLSVLLKANYITQSKIAFDILEKSRILNNSMTTEIANLFLKLELPFLNDVSISDVMKVRMNEDDAFQNFRVELEKQLRDLRSITDSYELKIKLNSVAHELKIQVREVEKALTQAKKALPIGVIVLAGSLVTAWCTSNDMLARAVIGAGGFATAYPQIFGDVRSKIRRNSSYFLWNILKNKKPT